MVTGIDLVEEQVRIARGEKLRYTQDDLKIDGHAIELRVYAEDPLNGFLPSIGTLEVYQKPEGEGIRVDDGYREGMAIPIYYDPMIAKLVAHGKDRTEALHRIKEAIRNYKIKGPNTTLPFGTFVFEHEAFISGHFDTHFVKDHYTPEGITKKREDLARIAALVALKHREESLKVTNAVVHRSTSWKRRLAH
jgi:propionyl-CoA carboxylase alpha chain